MALDRFRLVDVADDREVALGDLIPESTDFRGTVVIFWSAICSHCRRYDDYLSRLPARREMLRLLVIGARHGESTEVLRAAHRARDLRFPLFHDAEGELTRSWEVQQTPTAFLLDSRGRVVYRGAIDDFSYPQSAGHRAHLELAIDAHLAGRTVEVQRTASFGCPTFSVYYDLPSVVGQATATKTDPAT